MEPNNKKENSLSVPVAIIAAGIIVAAAVFFSRGSSLSVLNSENNQVKTQIAKTPSINLAGVKATDHLLGNPDAKIVLMEYADLECPACKYFDPILQQVMTDYGKSGEVAWVFRNFPIKELHPKAPHEAEAAECVAELGGNQKYWNFINKIYDVTPANNGLDPAQLPIIAAGVGVDKDQFNTCLNSGKKTAIVQADYDSGVTAGVGGTPTSYLILNKALSASSVKDLLQKTSNYVGNSGEPLVVVNDDSKIVSIGAAFPYEGIKMILDTVLAGIK